MGYVDEETAKEYACNGVLIGKSTPLAETKWTWWEVFKWNDRFCACVCSSSGISCGEIINKDEIKSYVD